MSFKIKKWTVLINKTQIVLQLFLKIGLLLVGRFKISK